jgi:hypothetical protein
VFWSNKTNVYLHFINDSCNVRWSLFSKQYWKQWLPAISHENNLLLWFRKKTLTSILSRQTRLIPCLKRPQHFITLSFIIPPNVQRSCIWIAIMYNYVYLHCLVGIHSWFLNIIDVFRAIMNRSAVHQHKCRLGKCNLYICCSI